MARSNRKVLLRSFLWESVPKTRRLLWTSGWNVLPKLQKVTELTDQTHIRRVLSFLRKHFVFLRLRNSNRSQMKCISYFLFPVPKLLIKRIEITLDIYHEKIISVLKMKPSHYTKSRFRGSKFEDFDPTPIKTSPSYVNHYLFPISALN